MNYQERLNKLLREMEKIALEAFLVTNPIDLFYLTGLDLSAGKLLVQRSGSALLVDGRYFEVSRNRCSVPVYLAKEQLLYELLKGATELGIDSETTSAQSFFDLQREAKKQNVIIRPLKSLVKALRAIKDSDELVLLRKAAVLGSEGFDYALNLLREGVSEAEVAFEIEFFWRKKGASGVAFDPIIAFGSHSSMPHYRAGQATLMQDQLVLMDIGVLNQHYHSDMTRVIYYGEVNSQLKKIRSVVQEAMERAFAVLKPGVTIGELDDAARGYITAQGYGEHFTHSLGHGVGLEIHEFPTIRRSPSLGEIPLQEGMVITIEPGIYLPGVGGVRLEDTVAITATGYENFTKRPYEVYVGPHSAS